LLRPALPGTATVYPPISTADTRFPTDYLGYGYSGPSYGTTPVAQADGRKALDRLIGWTAFYRRVSYAPGSDPSLYELIVVVTRRPTVNHRFAVPTLGSKKKFAGPLGRDASSELVAAAYDSSAPVPWWVTFAGLPGPPGGFPETEGFFPDFGASDPPATLTFRCNDADYGLFPPGTVFIPARNDDAPNAIESEQAEVGFGPPAPQSLPIYKVVDRVRVNSQPYDEVVVEYNGYYPRKYQSTPNPVEWPVWVIPPSFDERAGGVPVFDDESPVLTVGRRYVRAREIP
jgi:hypothetical protein